LVAAVLDELRERFAKTDRKRTELERLRGALAAKAARLTRLNTTRVDWMERFQRLIDEYNAGSVNIEEFFRRLLEFKGGLDDEQRRGLAEDLTEEQLAVFDLLMKPAPELTAAQRRQVKAAAEELLGVLKRGKLVLDWRKRQQTRAAVRNAVEVTLDERLPEAYDRKLYAAKCDAVYEHVYEHYFDDGTSVYDAAA
jgi:type I restriction enzyme R subunit